MSAYRIFAAYVLEGVSQLVSLAAQPPVWFDEHGMHTLTRTAAAMQGMAQAVQGMAQAASDGGTACWPAWRPRCCWPRCWRA